MGSGPSRRRRSAVVQPDSISVRTDEGNVSTSEVAGRSGILRKPPSSSGPRLTPLEQPSDQHNTGTTPPRLHRIQFEDTRGDSRSRNSDAESSLLSSPRGDRLSESQKRKIKHCLQNFESGLDVEFEVDHVIDAAQIVTINARESVFVYGVESIGLYVVDSGSLKVCTDKGETIIGHLLAGDFCGELSTLFDIKCTAQVVAECDSVLLFLPKDTLMSCLSGELNTDKLLEWCVMNCYVDLCGLFDTGHLTQELALWALKSCHLFNDLELSLISTIAQQAQLVVVSPGDTLCEIGDIDCPLYIIVRGSFEVSHGTEVTGHKNVKKCTNSYPVNVKSFVDMTESAQTVRAVGPCLVIVVDRTLLHRSLLI